MTATSPLNPLAKYDAAVSLKQNVFYKRLATVALAASIVAFAALGYFAVSFASTVCFPAHLSLVTVLILAVDIFFAMGIALGIWDTIVSYRKQENDDRMFKRETEEIATKDIDRILEKNLGFSSLADKSVKKNLLGRYYAFEEAVKMLKHEAASRREIELTVDGTKHTVCPDDYQMSKVDFKDPKQVKIYEKIQNLRVWRERLLYRAALYHLKAAFVLYLIQNPNDLRKYEDFVEHTTKDVILHCIAELARDSSARAVAKAAGKVFYRDEILKTSAPKLSSQIFGLKRNWL